MRRRSRTTRVLKWSALAASFALAVIWVESGTSRLRRMIRLSGRVSARVETGTLYVVWGSEKMVRALGRLDHGYPIAHRNCWMSRPLPDYTYDPVLSLSQVVVPLWLPFALMLTLTGFLWWRDRRRLPPGHCQQCGYNLTGNVSGRCPECGAAAEAESEQP